MSKEEIVHSLAQVRCPNRRGLLPAGCALRIPGIDLHFTHTTGRGGSTGFWDRMKGRRVDC